MDERLRAVRKDGEEAGHLSPEMLADLLSGEIEPDDLRRRVVPHLLARCPVCRRRVEGVRRLQERFDHWNESVVVREGQDAPRLLARLMEHPEEHRVQRLLTDEDFHTWGLAQLLLHKSREQALEDAHQALLSAELAMVVVDHLPAQPYHPDWLGDLKARAWAVLGNARRVAGELGTVELALRLAAARRQARPPNASPLATIRSLHYFLPVLDELSDPQLDPDYLDYLRYRLTTIDPTQTDGPASHR